VSWTFCSVRSWWMEMSRRRCWADISCALSRVLLTSR